MTAVLAQVLIRLESAECPQLTMTLRSQYLYFGVLALGFLVVSFSCHYSKPIEFDASESQPQDKSVIYPWTGDPDCQHFPVQVFIQIL
jgi:hypothetical protein